MGMTRPIVQTNDGDRRSARAGDGLLCSVAIAALTADANTLLTAGMLLGGIIITSGKTAGRTYTTDTAANLLLSMTNIDIGESLLFQVASTDGFSSTLAGGTGVTASGNLIVLTLTAKEFVLTRTGAATFNLIGL